MVFKKSHYLGQITIDLIKYNKISLISKIILGKTIVHTNRNCFLYPLILTNHLRMQCLYINKLL